MTRARVLGALAALAALAGAACVEIAAGPGGVASIRLDPLPLPPSIVVGDTLRDSTGAALRLRATAFDERGEAVAEAPFRFVFAPLSRDTLLSDNRAVVVDSLTGLVRAAAAFVVPQARVGVRLGERLQLLDTLEIVPRPRRLLRAAVNGDSVRTLAFSCADPATAAISTTTPTDTAVLRRIGLAAGSAVGNVATLPTLLVGDSATRDSVPVRSYLVRYQIVTPTTIPDVPLERGTRPAIGIIDGGADTPLRFDTTNAGGVAEPRLRLFAPGLGRDPFRGDTIPVTVRATALRTARDTVGTIQFVVRVVRITRSSLDGTPIACP